MVSNRKRSDTAARKNRQPNGTGRASLHLQLVFSCAPILYGSKKVLSYLEKDLTRIFDLLERASTFFLPGTAHRELSDSARRRLSSKRDTINQEKSMRKILLCTAIA